MGTRARDGGGRQNRGKTGLTTQENECEKGKLRLRENRRSLVVTSPRSARAEGGCPAAPSPARRRAGMHRSRRRPGDCGEAVALRDSTLQDREDRSTKERQYWLDPAVEVAPFGMIPP